MTTQYAALMRQLRRAAAALVAITSIAATPLAGQMVHSTLGPLSPFGDAKVLKSEEVVDTTSVALYAAAFLGATANVDGIAMQQQQGFQYLSVDLMVSASTLPTPRGLKFDVRGNLLRLHEHVTLTPLDSAGKPVTDGAALEILATLPDTILVAATTKTDSTSSNAAEAMLGVATRQFMPELAAGEQLGKRAGPAVASFLHLYHRPSAQLQVGYTSGPRDFGWLWYGKSDVVIEGTHYTSAALEIGKGTRYVKVHVTVTAEWQSHGDWSRDAEFVLALAPNAPAAAH